MNFAEIFGEVGLEAILNMPDEEFVNYHKEIRKELQETLLGEQFLGVIKESLLAQGHNNYLLIEDVEKSVIEIKEGLSRYSKEKQDFVMDIYMSIVNAIKEIAKNDLIKQMDIQITKLNEDAKLPTYAHNTDAAADVYASKEVTIEPFGKAAIPTGLAFAVPHGYQLNAYIRSGTSLKTPLMLANAVGICDAGYRDEMFVLMANISDKPYTIEKGERIAQFQLAPIIQMHWIEHENVKTVGENRGGGLGSTGTK